MQWWQPLGRLFRPSGPLAYSLLLNKCQLYRTKMIAQICSLRIDDSSGHNHNIQTQRKTVFGVIYAAINSIHFREIISFNGSQNVYNVLVTQIRFW